MLNLLCHFQQDRALAALGVFLILCQFSATLPASLRGRLLHSDSSPMSVEFLSRLLRMEICHLHAALEILSDERVGWIILHDAAADLPLVCHPSPGFVQGEGEGEGEGEGTPIVPKGTGGRESADGVLPTGYRKLSKVEQKQRSVLSNTPEMVSIGEWFGRRGSRLWTIAEAVSLANISPPPEDISLMGQYYMDRIDKAFDYRRRDLQTLLNNWAGELDRARVHLGEGGQP